MRIAITGGSGVVGSFIVGAARRAGHDVLLLGRRAPPVQARGVTFQPWELGATPQLAGMDALVHAAFSHLPGRYRGGEGNDPDGFMRANRDGSLRLFEAAEASGVATVIHVSSRAVFDGYPAGSLLTEDLPPRPTGAYGTMKVALERALCAATTPDFIGISLRATGVYGSASSERLHKWAPLFHDLASGKRIAPRVSTEVHGADLAQAVMLLLERAVRSDEAGPVSRRAVASVPKPALPSIFHAADIVLDRHDLATAVARRLQREDLFVPPRSDASGLSILDCTSLRQIGWQPGGHAMLEQSLPLLISQALAGYLRDRGAP